MKRIPYLLHRGNQFSFRIGVPLAYREIVGMREITKSLVTSDIALAATRALECAALCRRLFHWLKVNMKSDDEAKLLDLVKRAKEKLSLEERNDALRDEIAELRKQHIAELKQARLEAENEALRRAMTGASFSWTVLDLDSNVAFP